MKKKGFTLVELLAVIAILAILVIIALPNVMGMFNQAKQNSFTTEVKNILKQAGQQWVTDGSMNSTTAAKCYGRVDAKTSATDTTHSDAQNANVFTKELLLSGRTNLRYAVCLNKQGKITSFAATDDTYVVSYSGTAGLNGEDVTAADSGTGYTAGADANSKGSAKTYVITDTAGKSYASIGSSGTCSADNYTSCAVTMTLN